MVAVTNLLSLTFPIHPSCSVGLAMCAVVLFIEPAEASNLIVLISPMRHVQLSQPSFRFIIVSFPIVFSSWLVG